jgi:hypothetical protein
MKVSEKRITELVKENADFANVKLTEINITDSDNTFCVELEDNDSNLITDYIFKNNVISDNDLDNQIKKIVDKFN